LAYQAYFEGAFSRLAACFAFLCGVYAWLSEIRVQNLLAFIVAPFYFFDLTGGIL